VTPFSFILYTFIANSFLNEHLFYIGRISQMFDERFPESSQSFLKLFQYNNSLKVLNKFDTMANTFIMLSEFYFFNQTGCQKAESFSFLIHTVIKFCSKIA
jgi:hypothetical protein